MSLGPQSQLLPPKLIRSFKNQDCRRHHSWSEICGVLLTRSGVRLVHGMRGLLGDSSALHLPLQGCHVEAVVPVSVVSAAMSRSRCSLGLNASSPVCASHRPQLKSPFFCEAPAWWYHLPGSLAGNSASPTRIPLCPKPCTACVFCFFSWTQSHS